jgi:purine nucleosidase
VTDHAATRVVIDYDTGVDEAMAIFYGLLAPDIEVVGLTCCWGNTWVETATANTLRLREIVHMSDVPVAMGAKKPLIGPIWEFGSGVHGAAGLGNTNLPPPKLEPVNESAAELLVRFAHEHPGELTLVPIAPLKMSRRRSHLSRRSPNSTRRWC